MSFNNLSPWDAMRWFDLPRVTASIPPALAVTPLIGQEQRRVAIIFSAINISGNVSVSINPNMSANSGILISANIGVQLLHSEVGILVQVPWFVIGDGTATVTAFEVLLRDWPENTEEIRYVKANATPQSNNDLRDHFRQQIAGAKHAADRYRRFGPRDESVHDIFRRRSNP